MSDTTIVSVDYQEILSDCVNHSHENRNRPFIDVVFDNTFVTFDGFYFKKLRVPFDFDQELTDDKLDELYVVALDQFINLTDLTNQSYVDALDTQINHRFTDRENQTIEARFMTRNYWLILEALAIKFKNDLTEFNVPVKNTKGNEIALASRMATKFESLIIEMCQSANCTTTSF